ncbi:MAG: hypothetical protein H8E62_02825 [Planctomycetes bacterium]|nr:hypothetical protein [Planctomycetota bacterium]
MRTVKQEYLKVSFLVCASVLLVAASTKALLIKKLDIKLTKLSINLQNPLDDVNEKALLPYHIKGPKGKIDGATLESLGTDIYLQWRLEDTDAGPDSPTRYCDLFITYYTGNPDMVPHVPNECYVGGGNILKNAQTLSVDLPEKDKVAFQYVLFTRTARNPLQSNVDFSVQYLFHANGQYCKDRTDTRTALFDWFSKYSYFCKVEWKFFGKSSFEPYPSKEQTQVASTKLLSLLLPELEKNHWPDWDKINAKDDDPDVPAAF